MTDCPWPGRPKTPPQGLCTIPASRAAVPTSGGAFARPPEHS